MSALEVSRLKGDGMHFVGGVAGLCLCVAGPARSWILRYSLAGRRREHGLGSYPEVGVGDARRKASEARARVRQGVDPIGAARALKSSNLAAQAQQRTFAECARAFIADRESEWSNAKHAAQWASTLQRYAFPTIGSLFVRDVTDAHVISLLRPIWTTKHETASRVRNRIENVLDWAAVSGFRPKDQPNPARWTGHLEHVLAAPSKVAKIEHHRSLDYRELPAFMERLRQAEGQGAKALQFGIVCASRSGEVRGATWEEIDGDLWIIPGERMKAGREHRVPLTREARELLGNAGEGLLFPGQQGRALSDMTLTATLRRLGVDAVPHGFRATFKTWASEQTSFPSDVVEAALAHAIANKVEAAYQRGDLLEKRRKLMEAWSAYCTQPVAEKVTPIRRAKPKA